MRFRRALLPLGFLLLWPGVTLAQVPANADPGEPDFTLVVQGTFDAETLARFRRNVEDYAAMRSRLEVGLPPLVVTIDPDDIERFEHGLAKRIRHARSPHRGQLFPPAMAGQLKRMLAARADADTVAAIMEDGPTEFDVDINETYSKEHPLATMPPDILLQLPDLPKDIEYRFVGRHFVLRDARANIIIDEIPHALTCEQCVPASDDEDDEE
jgi:hypothetical protein